MEYSAVKVVCDVMNEVSNTAGFFSLVQNFFAGIFISREVETPVENPFFEEFFNFFKDHEKALSESQKVYRSIVIMENESKKSLTKLECLLFPISKLQDIYQIKNYYNKGRFAVVSRRRDALRDICDEWKILVKILFEINDNLHILRKAKACMPFVTERYVGLHNSIIEGLPQSFSDQYNTKRFESFLHSILDSFDIAAENLTTLKIKRKHDPVLKHNHGFKKIWPVNQ